MAKAAKTHLSKALNSHIQIINETFQMLDQPVDGSLLKIEWNEVTKLGDQISKQATIAGMLWSGDTPSLKELEENMGAYCNILQGFLLLCHGSMVGAGPTLRACIRLSAKQVTDCSLSLLREAVFSYESRKADRKLSIPQLAGSVWEVCASLKKIPTTNYTAIGRAITQVAVSIKDVLREMNELKPGPTEPLTGKSNEGSNKSAEKAAEPQEEDALSEDDLGNDLSPEEMAIAQLVINVVSNTLLVVKELIRFIMGLLKQSNPLSDSDCVDSLERLMEICQGIGGEIDELGACVYPPQEISLMKATTQKISVGIEAIQAEALKVEGSPEGLLQVCEGLKTLLRKLESELGSLNTDVEDKMQSLVLSM